MTCTQKFLEMLDPLQIEKKDKKTLANGVYQYTVIFPANGKFYQAVYTRNLNTDKREGLTEIPCIEVEKKEHTVTTIEWVPKEK